LIHLAQSLHLDCPSIIIADRGYESFNVYEHLNLIGEKFVIRVKDKTSRSLLSSIELPDTDEFDTVVDLKLTRSQTKKVKADPNTRFLSTTSKFDFLPEKGSFYLK
jgi:hypothetical protein